jgi:hypothetical protein
MNHGEIFLLSQGFKQWIISFDKKTFQRKIDVLY